MSTNNISFSNKVKIKLSSIYPQENHCSIAELAGMVLFSNEFTENKILFTTEIIEVMDKYVGLLLAYMDMQVFIKKDEQNPKKYYIQLEENNSKKLFNKFILNGHINNNIFVCQKCKEAFLRGAFLVSGYVNPPEKEYDFEIKSTNVDISCDMYSFMNHFISSPKMTCRKNMQIIYTKSGDNVSSLLLLMGANNYAFDLVNSQLIKSIRNEQNRQVNFYVANMKKQSTATSLQLEAIKYLKKTKKIKNLSPTLINTANLRYKYKTASIQELADLEEKKVSKSQESKRLSAIVDYYNSLLAEKGY